MKVGAADATGTAAEEGAANVCGIGSHAALADGSDAIAGEGVGGAILVGGVAAGGRMNC